MTTEAKPDLAPTWASNAAATSIHKPDNNEIASGWLQPSDEEIDIGTEPIRQRVNWFMRWASRCINYLLSWGLLLEWDKNITYRAGASVTKSGRTFLAKQETLGIDPSSDNGANWKRWGYEESDVATYSIVGLVKVDGTSIESKNGVLSIKALDPPSMTTGTNGIGRPDGITTQVDGGGKMSLIQKKRIARPISSTAFFFQTGNQLGANFPEDKKFTFPLNRALAIEKDNQFELASSAYTSDSFLFERGFVYQLKLINIWLWVPDMYDDIFPVCMSCYVSNIGMESVPLNATDIVFHFTANGFLFNNNQHFTSTVTFEVNEGASTNGWTFGAFTGYLSQQSRPPFVPVDFAKCVGTDPVSSIYYSFADFKFSQNPSLGGPFVPHKNSAGKYEMLDFSYLIDQSPQNPHLMSFLAIIEKFPIGG